MSDAPPLPSFGSSNDERQCSVCSDRLRCVVFTSCGHCCLCEECTRQLVQRDGAKCPLCREEICAKAWKLLDQLPTAGSIPTYFPEHVDEATRSLNAVKAWKRNVQAALEEVMVGLSSSLPCQI